MHQWIKQDEKLLTLYQQAQHRLGEYQPVHPQAVAAKALVVALLADAPARLQEAVLEAQREHKEAYLASQDLRAAHEEAEDAYEALHHSLQAALLLQGTRDKEQAANLRDEFGRTFSGRSPSVFRALSLDRMGLVLEQAVQFAPRLLDASDPVVGQASLALGVLREGQRREAQESTQALEARRALDAVRQQLRTHYVAARGVLEAAFLLDQRDDLHRFMEALHGRVSPKAPSAPQG